jgi:hypothetical protein
VAVAKNGTVFVADFLNNRIQKWRPKRRRDERRHWHNPEV